MATLILTGLVILTGLLYVRGWLRLRRMIPVWRAVSFLGGLLLVWLATASPFAMLDEQLLTAHMVQHLLLMTIGPPFILLGFPALALGVPNRFYRMPGPVFCWCAATAVLTGWHIPAGFALAYRSMAWHHAEHATFLIAGLLFWQPLIPSRPGGTHLCSR